MCTWCTPYSNLTINKDEHDNLIQNELQKVEELSVIKSVATCTLTFNLKNM